MKRRERNHMHVERRDCTEREKKEEKGVEKEERLEVLVLFFSCPLGMGWFM